MKLIKLSAFLMSLAVCSSPLFAKSLENLGSVGVTLNNQDNLTCKVYTYIEDNKDISDVYIETNSLKKLIGVDDIEFGQYIISGENYTDLNRVSNALGMTYDLSLNDKSLDLIYTPNTETNIFNTYKTSNRVSNGLTVNILNNTLNYKAQFISSPLSYTVSINDKSTGGVVKEYHSKNNSKSNTISGSIQLPTLNDGVYTVKVYTQMNESENILYSCITPIELSVENGNSKIELGTIYNHNKAKLNQFNNLDKDELIAYGGDEEAKDKVFNLANELCNGVSDDYTKAKILYEYVCNTMAYDRDKLNENRIEVQTLSKILETNLGVCIDYSLLYRELMKSVGIPTFVVSGYTNGGNNITYDKSITPTHAWNVSLIDGEWVVSDCTYGSKNKLEKGKRTNEPINSYFHFDMSLENLSQTHKILEVYEYKYK